MCVCVRICLRVNARKRRSAPKYRAALCTHARASEPDPQNTHEAALHVGIGRMFCKLREVFPVRERREARRGRSRGRARAHQCTASCNAGRRQGAGRHSAGRAHKKGGRGATERVAATTACTFSAGGAAAQPPLRDEAVLDVMETRGKSNASVRLTFRTLVHEIVLEMIVYEGEVICTFEHTILFLWIKREALA